jgi:hypothetical protein
MAKMYGDRGRENHDSPDNKPKNYFKHREESRVLKEAVDEITDFPHDRGVLCSDPKSGMVGCGYCYPEDLDDAHSPEDLEGIPNVLYNGKEPPSFEEI